MTYARDAHRGPDQPDRLDPAPAGIRWRLPGRAWVAVPLAVAGVLWLAQPPSQATGPATRPDAGSAAQPLAKVRIEVARPIREEDKKTARMTVRKDGRTVYRGWIGIEGHGQSTRRFPKRSWSIELRDSAGDNRDESLLGMPADDDWVLYAAYNEKTLMRNVIAYQTARQMGRYASRTRFVEVTLNGRYHGVYVLTEKLKLHGDRVDLPEPAQLLEWTSWNQSKTKGRDVRLPASVVPVVFEDPDRDEMRRERREKVRRSISAADRALYSPAFTDPAAGWRRHIDEPSAVDFALTSELFKNQDAFYASTYLAWGRVAAGRSGRSGTSTLPWATTA